ncbi:uncharacterized protein [Rutidosis leptorrhynchoides]|uniref:uncharacterized protein n=1 Tax=Rutidosis leptorrhynchoides TaxID=125765 RepID=UPI003A9A261F
MDEDSDRSSESTSFEIIARQRNHIVNNNSVDDDGDDYEDSATLNVNEFDDDDDDDQRDVNEFENSPMEIEEEIRISQSETLASGLAEVPIQYEMTQEELEHLKNQLQGSQQEALAIVITQAAQACSDSKIQLPKVPSSSSELSPSISSLAKSNSQDIHTPVANGKITTSDTKSVSTSRTVRTPSDGFNWRKYGQKQIKSPRGSRSYFKCSYNECNAKKIVCYDQYNTMTKIVHIGQHNHEPPNKGLTRVEMMSSSSSSRRLEHKASSKSGYKKHKSSGLVNNGQILVEEMDAPSPKQEELEHFKNQLQGSRQEALAIVPSSSYELSPLISSLARSNSQNEKITSDTKSVTTSRTVKTRIDGFNWRKYGQKQVKTPRGSRSYFKCTYNECIAKKIECCDQYNTVTKIVNKGQHNHEPPKKVLTRVEMMSSSPSSRGYKRHKSSGLVNNSQILVEEMDGTPPKQEELEHFKNQLQGNKIQSPKVSSSSSELSLPISSLLRLSSQEDRSVSTSRNVKTRSDGFNWRKYGQKQMKNTRGSRSYFRCTYNECNAKKIECSDQYNTMIKIIHIGQHNHEPPRKGLTRVEMMSSSPKKVLTRVEMMSSSPSSRGLECKESSKSGYKKHKSSGLVNNGQSLVEKMDAPPLKPRVKNNNLLSPAAVPKSPKKPKFVIHAASDIELSADGYKWKKYGQKMVKGNPHPRNYYKCTSAGCPVRKHIEMAVDGSSEVILTYEGIHDHEMPIRNKEQGSPSALLLKDVSPR